MTNVATRWRRWIPGARHGLPEGVAVYGVPRPDAEQLDGLLGRCQHLRTWARARGLELEGVPEDLRSLDQALDEAINQANSELGLAVGGRVLERRAHAARQPWLSRLLPC
jgi:hypothetical protein